ncbi:MAG TPA: NUDIX domain-containing protein [Candidatus Saccharimonadales bacterium]|nr:NUDIX domain-containing protein [Candidatus Saccharimonadales bacterium]
MEDVFHLGVKALLRNNKGEVLLLKVNPQKLNGKGENNYWDLPGGRVQKGDSVLDTLRREVKEETGIASISTGEEIGIVLANIRIPISKGESADLVLAIYTCSASDVDITLSEEHTAYQCFTPIRAAELFKVKYPEKFCKIIAAM